jgi:hypothetical protein
MHENDISWCSCQFLNSHINAVDALALGDKTTNAIRFLGGYGPQIAEP